MFAFICPVHFETRSSSMWNMNSSLLFYNFAKTISFWSVELEQKQINKWKIGTLHSAQFIGKMDWSLFLISLNIKIKQSYRIDLQSPAYFPTQFQELISLNISLEKCILFSSVEISYKYSLFQPFNQRSIQIQDENDLFACKHENKMRKSVAKQCRDDGKIWVVVRGPCKSLATDSIDWLNIYIHTHRERWFSENGATA